MPWPLVRPLARGILGAVNILEELGVRDDIERFVIRAVRDTVDNVFGTRAGSQPSRSNVPDLVWEDMIVEPMTFPQSNTQATREGFVYVLQRVRTSQTIIFRHARRAPDGTLTQVRLVAIPRPPTVEEAALAHGPGF